MNYIETHQKLFANQDTPLSYDYWSAIWCVGTAVGRSAYVDLPTPIFLNPYIYMISGKGFGKERTVIEISRDIVIAALPNNVVYDGRINHALSKSLNGQVAVAELSYPTHGWDFTVGILDGISACPPKFGAVDNPFATVLSSCEPLHTKKLEPIWPHTFFVTRQGKKELDHPGFLDMQPAIEHLREVHRYARGKVVTVTDAAQKFLDGYYNTTRPNVEKYPHVFGRHERNHVIRVAAIQQLASLSNVVDTMGVRDALSAVLRAKAVGSYFNASGSTKSPLGAEKVRSRILQSAQGVGHKALYAEVRHTLKSYEFNGLIELMREHGLVTAFHTGVRGGRVYIKNPKLNNLEAWDKVKEIAGYSPYLEDE